MHSLTYSKRLVIMSAYGDQMRIFNAKLAITPVIYISDLNLK
jgi:hypothetical protein